jgi:poly [ADP-ribose] polymerase
VIGVFRLERPGEAERFAKWEKDNEVHTGDRRLLWHGSWCGNFAGILSQGLRGDGIINPNGSGFCNGIFFADISTKSAGYCRASPGLEVLMLLCEVELGNETTNTPLAWRYIGRTVHSKWRDAEYIHPDFKGVLVPDVNAETTLGEYKSNFYNSEYVALNPSQVIQRYLFHIKLK